jgi:chromosome segregation ATPase
MRIIIHSVILMMLVLMVSGCATSETNPSNVSMWDLTGGKKRLDDYLQSRRDELAVLKDSTASLQKRLATQQAELKKVIAASKKKSAEPNTKNEKLYKEVSAKQVDLDEAKAKLNKISQNVRSYDQRISSGKVDNKNEAVLRVAEYQTDLEYQSGVVEKLERDIAKLKSQVK